MPSRSRPLRRARVGSRRIPCSPSSCSSSDSWVSRRCRSPSSPSSSWSSCSGASARPVIEIPTDLPAEIVPLSWLLGVWEGTGVVDYKIGDDDHVEPRVRPARQLQPRRAALPQLQLVHLAARRRATRRSSSETGYWRLERPAEVGDRGPGMLPGVGRQPVHDGASRSRPCATSRRRLRHRGARSSTRPASTSSTSARSRARASTWRPTPCSASQHAKEYTAATRLYGLVENHLLWAWDIAALGQELRTHASGRLARVD